MSQSEMLRSFSRGLAGSAGLGVSQKWSWRRCFHRSRRRSLLTRECSSIRAYRQSKLAQILFTFDLAQELEGSGITVNALHPATFMNTKMVRDFGTPRSTVEEGALAILKLATSAEVEGRSGLYFNGQEEARADAQAYDPQARQRLKRFSLELTGYPLRTADSTRLSRRAMSASPPQSRRRSTQASCPLGADFVASAIRRHKPLCLHYAAATASISIMKSGP
jgi:NAD(P)-dependent dehydrogenase (short-subunit alcohol dehydrogenase family)